MKKISFFIKHLKQKRRKKLLASFGPHTKYVVADTEFGPMICDPQDGGVTRQLLKWGNYNPNEIQHLLKFINCSQNMLLVGGHIGALAIPLSRHVNKLSVIEANPENFSLLNSNLKINNVSNCTTYNFAATSEKKDIDFLLSTENSGGSKIAPKKAKVQYLYDNPRKLLVEGMLLDDVLKPEFDIVIMDIEGSEFDAILGANSILKSATVFVVEFIPNHIFDVANRTINEFANLLLELNFDHVEFPLHGAYGSPETILKKTLIEISTNRSYEDGIIFSRKS